MHRPDPPVLSFANESDAVTLGDLHIENREDRLEIDGSLDVRRNKTGLVQARTLKKILDDVVDALQREELPEQPTTEPTQDVANPFTDTHR